MLPFLEKTLLSDNSASNRNFLSMSRKEKVQQDNQEKQREEVASGKKDDILASGGPGRIQYNSYIQQ